MAAKPPLPPRAPSSGDRTSSTRQYLSPASPPSGSPYLGGVHDPRSSSTQSLGPVKSASDERRTLLIVYIHGFLGDETSFKSFPAHVHGLLTPALAGTHVVYTKIYPRYKSRENVAVARNALSSWLAVHESDSTDIILIGHSLGGILAAEVVLMPSDGTGSRLFQHRILGLIAFDTPFLGMHPGVVGTGIASLFRSPPQLEALTPQGPSPFPDLFSAPQDPTYNPSYANDVHLANRKGKLQRALYFWNKHAGELAKAARNYVSSHLEFGGCLADYPGLRTRYRAIRALEDVEETMNPRAPNGRRMKRVRFVNYYSASTGPVKDRPQSLLEGPAMEVQTPPRRSSGSSTHSSQGLASESPHILLKGHGEDHAISQDFADLSIDSNTPKLSTPPPARESTLPSSTSDQTYVGAADTHTEVACKPSVSSPSAQVVGRQGRDENIAPTVLPEEHPNNNASTQGNTTTEMHTQEGNQFVRTRMGDVKHQETADTGAKYQQQPSHTEQLEQPTEKSAENEHDQLEHEAQRPPTNPPATKKLKDRMFCALPGKDPVTGERDRTWIKVHMEGIDEVVAHTSLFNIGETYAKLVGDTVERIEKWVAEDASTRMILAEMNNGASEV